MTRLSRIAAVALALAAGPASAASYHYSMTFTDAGTDSVIGSGDYRFDSSDTRWYADPACEGRGLAVHDPAYPFCPATYQLTPLQSVHIQIAGQDALANSDSTLFAEASYTPSRYGGGAIMPRWFIGDAFFGMQALLIETLPEPGVETWTTTFMRTDVEQNLFLNGTVSFVQIAPIPLPATALLMLGDLAALSVAGRRRR